MWFNGSQQCFSHVWKEPQLPGNKAILWGVSVTSLRKLAHAINRDFLALKIENF